MREGMRSKDDALNDLELDTLLKAADSDDPREALIILLAGDLGLREGEISALRSSSSKDT